MIEDMVETRDLDVTIFFYNPNIHPRAEYEIRKEENRKYLACTLISGAKVHGIFARQRA